MLGTLNIGSLARHIGPLLLVTLSLIICNIQIKRFSSYVIFCAGIIYLEQKWKSAYLSIMEDESKVLVEFSNGNFRTLYSRDLYGKLILTYNKRRKKNCAHGYKNFIYLYCLRCHENASVSWIWRNGLFFPGQWTFKWKSEEAW